MNLVATKGRGGNSVTATLTATGLVPRKRTARSSEASTSVAALSLRLAIPPSLPCWHEGNRLVGLQGLVIRAGGGASGCGWLREALPSLRGGVDHTSIGPVPRRIPTS
jgi:hypothetical protein